MFGWLACSSTARDDRPLTGSAAPSSLPVVPADVIAEVSGEPPMLVVVDGEGLRVTSAKTWDEVAFDPTHGRSMPPELVGEFVRMSHRMGLSPWNAIAGFDETAAREDAAARVKLEEEIAADAPPPPPIGDGRTT